MAAKARPKIKTEILKLKVSPDDLEKIDAAKEISGHATRTAYMVDSALSGSPVYLHGIAVAIGKLGQICNEVLLADETTTPLRLSDKEAKQAVKKIIKTCDAVTAALRR